MALIAVDFDHTLVDRGEPRPYAKEALNLLREAGHKIMIHSCNNPRWIERVMNNNDMRYDYIWDQQRNDNRGGKPVCDLYVDDRGYHFRGDWKEALPEIVERLNEQED